MALRLIEMILKEKYKEEIYDLLKKYEVKVIEHLQVQLLEGNSLVRILVDAEQVESVVDLLNKEYTSIYNNRIVILPVEATLPREEIKEPEKPKQNNKSANNTVHIGREEIYEDIKSSSQCSRTFITMTILSTIVAAIGLIQNSIPIIIGGMVIAPLLGTNISLALGTTLGDLFLIKHAFRTSITGILLITLISAFIGYLVTLDITLPEIISRLNIKFSDIILGLASGFAGTMAFTTGLSTALIGVMVAVAILPPLVVFGLLLGSGHFSIAFGAFLLFIANILCINFSATIMFLIQGIRPTNWWEAAQAKRATRTSIICWLLLSVLLGLVLIFN